MDTSFNFFSNQIDTFFRAYSLSHFSALFVIGLSVMLSIFILKKLSEKERSLFRFFLAMITIVQQILFIMWVSSNNTLNAGNLLPFNMCTIALFLSFFALLTKNKIVFNILYFWGVIGSIYALFFPSLLHDFPHFRYFEFFIAHGCIVIAIFYFIFVEKYQITFRETVISYFITDLYVIIVYFINMVFDTNFLFLMKKPSIGLLIGVPDFVFKLWLILGTLMLFIILYLPFKIFTGLKQMKPIVNA